MTYVSDIRGTRVMTGLVPALYDRVDVTYPNTTTEVYTFSLDSYVIGVVTIIYTTSTKDNLLSAERTA